MKSIASHHLHIRALAVLMVLFSVLSSGRTLVPGLCATLNALKDGAPRESCCTTSCPTSDAKSAAEENLRSEKERPDCAFCKFAHALVKVQAFSFLDSPMQVVAQATVPFVDAAACAVPRQAARPRDPPAFVFS
ncbi:MAG: hypothetical protein IT366_18940 [Candidatus Hydrogenedentes bacterium]|nr:hypothetical protein [Candidatus Hydrogenedentota bacterium]